MNATHLVEILLTLGRAKEARRYAEEAIALTGDADPPTLQTLSCWATLSAFEGRVSEAAQLFGFLDAECPRQEVPRYPGQALRGKLDSLVESRFLVAELQVLRAEGACWTFAGANEFTLRRLLPPPS
jgi:hypothetical protein